MVLNRLAGQTSVGAGTAPERPILCLEVNPPRGVDPEPAIARLTGALKGVDCLNVTDSALARMKSAALPFGALLKQRTGLEVLVNVSCRDRNLLALQSDLLAGWMHGVRSVVALTGDAVTVGDSPERKGVFEVNSIGLLNAVRVLNSGRDLAQNELAGAPAYICGVVANPNAKNVAVEAKRLLKKRDAGATYALTQPVFDLATVKTFLTEIKQIAGMGVLLGLMPFKSVAGAEALAQIPGIRMPESVLQEVRALEPARIAEYSIRLCEQLVQELRGEVLGFHIISGALPKLGIELTQRVSAILDTANR